MARIVLRHTSCRARRNRRAEKQLVNDCIKLLILHGFIPIRTNSGLIILDSGSRRRAIRMASPGVPDIIACSPDGRFIAIECKTDNGRLTQAQKDFLERLKRTGAVAAVVRCIDELLEIIHNYQLICR